MTIREYEPKQLLEAQSVSTSTVQYGSWVDTQGYIGHGGREAKLVLMVGTGTTAGTAGGHVQSAEDTAGTGVSTVATFTTITTVGGIDTKHGVVPAAHRYVRPAYSVQTDKDMIMAMLFIQQARVRP